MPVGGMGGMGAGMGGPGGVSSSAHMGSNGGGAGAGGGGGGGAGSSMGGLPGMPASVPGLIPTTGASLLGGGNQLGAPCVLDGVAVALLHGMGLLVQGASICSRGLVSTGASSSHSLRAEGRCD